MPPKKSNLHNARSRDARRRRIQRAKLSPEEIAKINAAQRIRQAKRREQKFQEQCDERAKMEQQYNLLQVNNDSSDGLIDYDSVSIKQEVYSEIMDDVQIKIEPEDNDHLTTEDLFENMQQQVKQEYPQTQSIEKQVYHDGHETFDVTIENDNDGSNCKIEEDTITNIYDDDIEIKQEDDRDDSSSVYAIFDDTQSMNSDEAKALIHVEACLQEDFKIKTESELFEINQNHEMDKVNVKDEMELMVTETHLISNKLFNTTSTVTNPHDGLIESQTTKTLIMEILPMQQKHGVSLNKIDNPEEILPTSYTHKESNEIDYDDTFQLNSITGNVMSLEQEAYGLLEAKNRMEEIDRPFVCNKCPKTYKTAACLRKHKNVHTTIEKRAMGIIKGKKTRMANIKKKLKEEDNKYSPKSRTVVKNKIKIVNVVSLVDNVKKEGYECTCGNVFRRRSRMETCLRSHNMCSDLNSYYPCVTCCKQFKDKEELALHRKRLHRKRFPCKFCPTDYNTRKELFKHLQIHQKVQVMEYKVLSEVVKGKQKLKCFMCSKTCLELSELKSHVMDDHKEPYICPRCNRTFSKIIDFGNHTKTDHPEVEGQSVLDVLEAFSKLVKAWKCEECEVQFHEADKLALHQIEKHSPDIKIEPQFQCIDCRRVFISQKGLTSHRRVHHNIENVEDPEMVDNTVMCIECRKICRDSNALSSHMRLHSMERKYPCKFCDFRFATPEKRRVHSELHTGDMKFVCFICEYQCTSENRLKHHKLSAKHLNMKDFLATGKPLKEEKQSTSKKTKVDEKNEWVVVKGERGEQSCSTAGEGSTCDICGERFQNESKMLEHQNTHPFIEIPNDDKPTRIFFK